MSLFRFRPPGFVRILFPNRIWRMDPAKKSIYLTFDDGPTFVTDWLLDELKKENIKATFFCVGANVRQNPQLFARIKNEGHVVANHTDKHEHCFKNSTGDYLDSVNRAAEYIDSNLFRPPYGRINFSSTMKIRKLGYKIIMWSWLSNDFDAGVEGAEVIKSAKKVQSGDILVFHDNEKSEQRLKVLLPEVVKIVKSKNLNFETISF